MEAGYTGTEEEFIALLGNTATGAERAEAAQAAAEAAQSGAEGAKTDAEAAKAGAEAARDSALDYAASAAGSAADAQEAQDTVTAAAAAAQTAQSAAEAAREAANASAAQAGQSATAAAESADDAQEAAAGAQTDRTAAETAKAGAEAAALQAETQAANAAGSAGQAAQDAAQAASSAALAESYAHGGTSARAGEDTDNAQYYAAQAATSGDSAAAAATAAAGSAAGAATAQSAAETARDAAQAARDAAETAQSAAETARDAAGAKATEAAGNATAAAQSVTSAAAQVTLAQSWAEGGTGARAGEGSNNAKYWSDRAQEIAGGDFVTPTALAAAVQDHDADTTAHQDIRTALAAKQAQLSGTQGQVVGFDANGNAVAQAAPDTGVTTFNGRSGAVTPAAGDYTAADVGADPAGSAATVQGNLTSHAGNTSHITAQERAAWNAKQDAPETAGTEGQVLMLDSSGNPMWGDVSDPPAASISYDNTGSGLSAQNVQTAIDELQAIIDAFKTGTIAGEATAKLAASDGTELLESGSGEQLLAYRKLNAG